MGLCGRQAKAAYRLRGDGWENADILRRSEDLKVGALSCKKQLGILEEAGISIKQSAQQAMHENVPGNVWSLVAGLPLPRGPLSQQESGL